MKCNNNDNEKYIGKNEDDNNINKEVKEIFKKDNMKWKKNENNFNNNNEDENNLKIIISNESEISNI